MKRLAAIACLLAALAAGSPTPMAEQPAVPEPASQQAPSTKGVAIFAAGCFWCVEADFDKVPGVLDTTSGYTGGELVKPTYEDVSLGTTGHVEAVRVTYDPAKVSYRQLLDYYWRHVDLTDGSGQFCDRGPTYRPAIFVSDERQNSDAAASKQELEDSGRFARIAVEIKPAFRFWPAEEEHQNYYKKNPYRYKFYRAGCGRDARLSRLWGSEYTH